jgi:hypothetical protein
MIAAAILLIALSGIGFGLWVFFSAFREIYYLSKEQKND